MAETLKAAKVNGVVKPKTKVAPKSKTAAATKKATAEAAASKKTAKRSASDSDEEDEAPKPKKAKTVAPKAAAPAKKAAKPVAKTSLAELKAAQKKTPEEKPEKEVEVEDKIEIKKPAPSPKPVAKVVEKFFTPQPGVKAQPKIPNHKIGAKINDAPTEKLDIYVFGEGSSGELGLGSKKDANGRNPIDVKRPRLNPLLLAEEVGVVQIAVGGMHCAALTHDNRILTWGVNDQGALGRDTKWEGGLKEMTESDDDSEDEDADMNPRESTPEAIDSKWFAEGTKFVQLVASDSATYALTEDGAVYGWGTFRSNDGILGFTESKLVQWYPVLVPELKKIVTMAAGSNHILAVNRAGRAYAWGSGQQNQLGRRVVERIRLTGLVPREFGLRGKISKIACGSYHSFAIDDKGSVYSWGLNSFGETGINEELGEDNAYLLKPSIVESLKKYEITDISGGGHHSIACTKDGKVLVWGRCDGGQLGIKLEDIKEEDLVKDEHGKARIVKNPVILQATKDAVAVNAGSDNSFVVTKSGQAWSFGFNANYQTGQGDVDDVMEATLIANSAVKDKKIISAMAGGQFGVLVGRH